MNKRLLTLFKALATIAVISLLAPTVPASDVQGAAQSAKDGKRLPNAVVYISDIKGNFKPPAKPVEMDQKNKEFVPSVLAVLKGTTVRFQNSDTFLHNVYANSRAAKFNFSQSEKGKYSEVVLDKFGVIAVRCHIHAKMKAYIAVLDNPYFAVTNDKGLFKIPNVPAGTYTVKVWSESGTASETIKVGGSGATTVLLKVK